MRGSFAQPSGRADERALLYGAATIAALLAVLPLGRLVLEAIAPGGVPSLGAFQRVYDSPAVWRALGHSLETSLGATALAVVVGTTAALALSLTDVRRRGLLTFLFVMPLIIAPQVMALAWLQISGPASPLLKAIGLAPPLGTRNPLYSREGIILLLAVEYAPLVFLTVKAGLRALPRELVEAAQAAGAGPFMILRTIVLPLLTPALVAGGALVFVSALGNFGIPAFLGIPGGYLTLPTLIYQRLSGLGPGVLPEVAALSMLIGMLAVAGLLLQGLALRKGDFRVTTTSLAARPFALGRWRRAVELGLLAVALLVVVLPLLGLLATALIPAYGVPLNSATATSANFAYVLFEHGASKRAVVNSLALSAVAAVVVVVLAIVLGHFLVWRDRPWLRWLSLAAELPYALPGVVLAIACILIFLKPLPLLGFSLYNTVWILLIAYLARFLALGLRPIVSGYQQLDRNLEEAAQVAGAGIVRRLVTINAPLLAPVAGAGAILVFL
ncbi:MAG: ABC transporter permease, partial [Beijerinckiaceae bacterium]